MSGARRPARVSRRQLLAASGAGLVIATGLGLGVGLGIGRAAPAVDGDARRLANRLELWSTFARQSTTLLAQYTSTRTSPLLREPLPGSGALAFVAPHQLVLRDHGATGSTTRIEPRALVIAPNDPSLPRRPLPTRSRAPALRWLADHLLASFAPGDGSALTRGARVEIPRGRTPRITLLPPRDSAARALIRSVTLSLDPVGGAVVRVEIAQSDGGTYGLVISDHRQQVDDEQLARTLDDEL